MTHGLLIPVLGQSLEETVAAAREYIASRTLNGVEISSSDLRLLLCALAIPLEMVAELLGCHPELIKRKAERWDLLYSQLPPKRTASGNSRYISRNDREKKSETKYSAELVRAQSYIEQHDLLHQEPTRAQYEYLYLTLGLPITALGRLLKRTDRIRFDLTNAGIERRSSYEQKYHRYKTDFFKTWSPEMAWVLGLLYTDGYITEHMVGLASIDVELLSSVGALLFNRFEISEYLQPDGRNRISKLGVYHPKILSDLRSLGLEERKSLTMQFPNVPDEYVRHFIRGCWDGDGGFTVSKGKLYAHYTCGSLAFIEKLAHELFKTGITRRILRFDKSLDYRDAKEKWQQLRHTYGRDGPYPLSIYKRRNANAYDLRLSGRAQLAPLFEYLYKEVPEHMLLLRKYDLIRKNL